MTIGRDVDPVRTASLADDHLKLRGARAVADAGQTRGDLEEDLAVGADDRAPTVGRAERQRRIVGQIERRHDLEPSHRGLGRARIDPRVGRPRIGSDLHGDARSGHARPVHVARRHRGGAHQRGHDHQGAAASCGARPDLVERRRLGDGAARDRAPLSRQLLEEATHRRLALFGLLREGLVDRRALLGWQEPGRGIVVEGGRRLGGVEGGPLERGAAGERTLAGEHLERHQAERVEIRARIDLATRELLGAHVRGRAHDGARGGDLWPGLRLALLGDPEVEHPHVLLISVARQEHVVGLQIAVDDPPPVGLVERARHLSDQALDHREGHGPFGDRLGEGAPLDELHGDVEPPVGERAEVVEADGVGVAELHHRLALAQEAPARLLVRLPLEHFDRDLADRGAHGLLGRVDGAHAPLAEGLHQTVAPGQGAPDQRVGARLGEERGPAVRAEARVRVVRLAAGGAGRGHRGPKRRPDSPEEQPSARLLRGTPRIPGEAGPSGDRRRRSLTWMRSHRKWSL